MAVLDFQVQNRGPRELGAPDVSRVPRLLRSGIAGRHPVPVGWADEAEEPVSHHELRAAMVAAGGTLAQCSTPASAAGLPQRGPNE